MHCVCEGKGHPSWTDLWGGEGTAGKVNVRLDLTEAHIYSASKSLVTTLSDLAAFFFCARWHLWYIWQLSTGQPPNTLHNSLISLSHMASQSALKYIFCQKTVKIRTILKCRLASSIFDYNFDQVSQMFQNYLKVISVKFYWLFAGTNRYIIREGFASIARLVHSFISITAETPMPTLTTHQPVDEKAHKKSCPIFRKFFNFPGPLNYPLSMRSTFAVNIQHCQLVYLLGICPQCHPI